VIPAVKIVLLLFAALGFAGAGAALAIGRLRELTEGEADVGMRALAFVLCIFSGACTISAAGYLGVAAFGGVVVWTSYVLCAQHVGVFRVEYFNQRESEPAGR
jgi:fatty acid desaturase